MKSHLIESNLFNRLNKKLICLNLNISSIYLIKNMIILESSCVYQVSTRCSKNTYFYLVKTDLRYSIQYLLQLKSWLFVLLEDTLLNLCLVALIIKAIRLKKKFIFMVYFES